jgi:hypothetical protein
VSSDQTKIHLIPNGDKRTWESKGTKRVQVLSFEDKKQLTMVVSSSVIKDLLPPQIVFTSSTPRTLPLNSKGKTYCINDGWDLTLMRITSHLWKRSNNLCKKSFFLTCNPKSNY